MVTRPNGRVIIELDCDCPEGWNAENLTFKELVTNPAIITGHIATSRQFHPRNTKQSRRKPMQLAHIAEVESVS